MTAETLQLFDANAYCGELQHPGASNHLQDAIDYFMQFVELSEGDPGYVLSEDGTVENHYVRTYNPALWGADADIFELRYIERRLHEIDADVACAGLEFLFGKNVVEEAIK